MSQRALSVFTKREIGEIFASLGAGNEEIQMLLKFKEYSSLGFMDERKEFFRNASPGDKSSLWKINLIVHLVSNPSLNKKQKQLIVEALSLVTPEFFSITKENSEWKVKVQQPVQNFVNRLLEEFSNQEVVEIFAKLENQVPKSSTPNLLAGPCECNLDSIYQCGLYYCTSDQCNRRNSGCGLFWAFECNGRCPPAN